MPRAVALLMCTVLAGCGASRTNADAATPITGVPEFDGETGAIEGLVRDPAGGDVPDADVAIRGAFAIVLRSDRRGGFALGRLPPGRYEIVVRHDTMQYDGRSTADVAPGGAARVTIIVGGGPVVRAATDPLRGARIYDDYRYYNATSSTGGLPAAMRCRTCHGWRGEARIGGHGEPLRQYARRHSEAQIAWFAWNAHGSGPDLRGVLSRAFDPEQQLADVAAFLKRSIRDVPSRGSASTGRALFVGNCAPCHGLDGRSIDFHQTSNEPPEYLSAAVEEADEFTHRIENGHPRPAEQQEAIWLRWMPAWREMLGPQQVADVMAHLRTFTER